MSFNLGGWIAVSRKLFTGPEWAGEPYSHREAWIELIALARFEAGDAVVGGRRVLLQRGQLAWSVAQLAKRWKWSPGKVNRFLSELQAAKRIDRLPSHVTSVMTIVNYDRYQFGGATDGLTASAGQPTDQPAGRPIERPTGQPVGQLVNSESAFNSGPKPTANGRDGLTDELTDGVTNGESNGSTDGLRSNKLTNKQPSPPTPQGALEEWRGVIEELLTIGVATAAEAAAVAAANGCRPEDFRPHLEYWKRNQWKWDSPLGVIAKRLERLRPGQPGDEAWPQPSPESERDRRRSEAEIRDAKAAEEKQARKAADEAGKRRRDAQRGRLSALDAVGRAELARLAVRDPLARRHHGTTERASLEWLADHPDWEPSQLTAIGVDGAEGFEPL